jgi:hypothetical protein
MSFNTLIMKAILPVDLISGKEDVRKIIQTNPDANGKYRKVWIGNYKVLKFDTLTDGRESNKKEVYSYTKETEGWLPKLYLTSPNLKYIVSEKLTTVGEDAGAVYQAARTKLGPMVSWFLTNPCFQDKDEAWTYGVRLFLYYTKQCMRFGYMTDPAQFNNHFNWGFKKHFPNGADWHKMLTPALIELCTLFEEDVLVDLHHANIGISQFDGSFKLLDFGGN